VAFSISRPFVSYMLFPNPLWQPSRLPLRSYWRRWSGPAGSSNCVASGVAASVAASGVASSVASGIASGIASGVASDFPFATSVAMMLGLA